MNILTSIGQALAKLSYESWPPAPTDDFWYGSPGRSTASGIRVDQESGLRSATVFTCIRLTASVLASLPLNVYRRLDNDGKEPAKDHPLFRVLHSEANPRLTAFEWKERVSKDLDTWGNHYSFLRMDGKGNVIELWPLRPDRVRAEYLTGSEQAVRVFHYTLRGGERSLFFENDILHIPGFGFDGLRGMSPIEMMMQDIGLDIALQEFGSRFFSNGATPRLVIKHPTKLTNDAIARLKERFKQVQAGLWNAHETAVLEEGMDIKEIGLPPEHAQFIETRKFSRGVIAGIFQVPPHMIGDTEKTTSWGTGIEQQQIGWVITSILPRAKRVEDRIQLSLFGVRERNNFFAEFLIAGLMRGDAKSRSDYYQRMIDLGVMSPNDVRRLENMNPIPGGDVYRRPLNMMFVDADGRPAISLPPSKRARQRLLAEIIEPKLLSAPEREGNT